MTWLTYGKSSTVPKCDYTYSHVHLTYSRMDHVFTSASSLPFCTSSKILETSWLDHSPVVVNLSSLHCPTASYTWRLNDSHLSNPATCLDIEMALKSFFTLNDPSHTSSMCTWAAHKATIIGILIQTAVRYRRHYKALLKQKEDELAALLKEYKHNPHLDLWDRIESARLELNICLTTKVEKQLRWTQARFYSQSDKLVKLLSNEIGPQTPPSPCP